jgi:hypothetical protein
MTALLTLLVLGSLDGGTADAGTNTARAALPREQVSAAKHISAEALRAHVRFLASDALEGRAPGTAGDAKAQQYLVAQFQKLGLEPGAPDGGYLQPFAITALDGHPDAIELSAGTGNAPALKLKFHDDFIALSGNAQPRTVVENAELVFVGYGIVAPEFQWNDYKRADLRGKVLVMMNSDPAGDPTLFAGPTRLWYGRWDYKYESAAKAGAVGAIIIHTTPSAGYPWQVVQTSWSGEQFKLPGATGPLLPLEAWVTEQAARRITSLAGRELDALRASAEHRDFVPVPLGVKLRTSFESKVLEKQTANVLAKITGSDPTLSGEAILYTAHHDHLGRKVGVSKGKDSIYNGAVDNASGVAQLLAVARAYRALPKPPRRTIYFAAVAAEEAGLFGSQYLAEHLPLASGRVAANINIDGANIWGRTRDLVVIGHGKSSLDASIERIAATQGRHVTPDRMPDRGFFYRSDQFNFAKLGVPAAYAESGLDYIGRPPGWGKATREAWEEQHYHQPSDELKPGWDFSGAIDDARLYFFLGNDLANSDEKPRWNPGDEFEAPRLKALKALEGK